MEILCVSKDEYRKNVIENRYSYNTVWFHELNEHKVDQVVYLLFKDSKVRLGLIAGIKDNILKVPYSAPFACFDIVSNIDLEGLEKAVTLLEQFCVDKNINKIILKTPPLFYDECFLSKLQNTVLRMGYIISCSDLNYQFVLKDEESYRASLFRNAKKNLNNAMKYSYHLRLCESEDDKKEAYDIIAENRKSKGYPLRMTWDEVNSTIQKMKHHCFILELDGESVASAIVFGVTEAIYQVIYWGDRYGFEKCRPMNYLAYILHSYYYSQGVQILDIGPSTEDGIPNYGLCSFKESIGCVISNKYTYEKCL